MLSNIFKDERVVQVHICNEEKAHNIKLDGYVIQVESVYPSFKGVDEDDNDCMFRYFYTKGNNLEDAINKVLIKLQNN